MSRMKVIAVVGPTASGKTALAVQLARMLGGEVIGADSMQIYRGMPVATAAPTAEECMGVPYHLVGFLPQTAAFSAADFSRLAAEKAAQITARGHVPILAGGTGLFIDSFLKNIVFSPVQADAQLRARLAGQDKETLYETLRRIDPQAAEKIHPNNVRRVIRALEMYYTSGETKSALDARAAAQPSPYLPCYIGIDYRDRSRLYACIDRRVDEMAANGLVEEARRVLASPAKTSAQAIGHKELAPYFSGEITLEAALDNIRRETRRYAKRQQTWFRRNAGIHWFYADDYADVAELYRAAGATAKEFLNEKEKD